MENDAVQALKRSYNRSIFIAVAVAIVAVVLIGLFVYQVYQYPNKFTLALLAFWVAAMVLMYRYGFYLPMKRKKTAPGCNQIR